MLMPQRNLKHKLTLLCALFKPLLEQHQAVPAVAAPYDDPHDSDKPICHDDESLRYKMDKLGKLQLEKGGVVKSHKSPHFDMMLFSKPTPDGLNTALQNHLTE